MVLQPFIISKGNGKRIGEVADKLGKKFNLALKPPF